MIKNEETLMKLYGITNQTKMMYYYKQYTYEKLADALRYAEIDVMRNHQNQPRPEDTYSLKGKE